MGGNALYVVVVDPAVAGTEYNPIDVLYKTMTDEQKRAPETQDEGTSAFTASTS